MNNSPLYALSGFGQSVWLDFLGRNLIDSGALARLMTEDGLSGVTSNPAIFEQAIGGSNDYDDEIRKLSSAGNNVAAIYESLTVRDVADAADLLLPQYERTNRADGYVSLEVSPHLAYDTEGTLAEARRLWDALNRPNVMIKVPGTAEGLPVIRQLISDGINVNVTLLFSLQRYREVAEAYIAGLEDRLALGKPIDHVASVASFFLSRIDARIDPMLNQIVQRGGEDAELAKHLCGKVAVANAKLAYRDYQTITGQERYQLLAGKGALPQRLLWASTSAKNPAYSNTMYVEPLIGADTVTTLPLDTVDIYREHGRPAATVTLAAEEARRDLFCLRAIGIDLDAVTQQLEVEGIQKFVAPHDSLMATIEKKCSLI